MGAERCELRRVGQADSLRCGEVREKLRAIDFALNETALYLDAYPNCAEALAYYQQLQNERQTLHERYVQSYGPLLRCDNASSSSWQWVQTPWPWEPEAN